MPSIIYLVNLSIAHQDEAKEGISEEPEIRVSSDGSRIVSKIIRVKKNSVLMQIDFFKGIISQYSQRYDLCKLIKYDIFTKATCLHKDLAGTGPKAKYEDDDIADNSGALSKV